MTTTTMAVTASDDAELVAESLAGIGELVLQIRIILSENVELLEPAMGRERLQRLVIKGGHHFRHCPLHPLPCSLRTLDFGLRTLDATLGA